MISFWVLSSPVSSECNASGGGPHRFSAVSGDDNPWRASWCLSNLQKAHCPMGHLHSQEHVPHHLQLQIQVGMELEVAIPCHPRLCQTAGLQIEMYLWSLLLPIHQIKWRIVPAPLRELTGQRQSASLRFCASTLRYLGHWWGCSWYRLDNNWLATFRSGVKTVPFLITCYWMAQ